MLVHTVALYVMMLHVVVVIRIPCVAHERLDDVWEGHVQPLPAFLENAVVVDVIMHKKGE